MHVRGMSADGDSQSRGRVCLPPRELEAQNTNLCDRRSLGSAMVGTVPSASGARLMCGQWVALTRRS